MTTTLSPSPAPQAARTRPRLPAEALGWLALLALLALLAPLFLNMPLTPDASYYDVCARYVLRGGSPEKDFLFLPPPGLVWAFAAVRALFGPSAVALRAADLAVFGGIVALLAAWLRGAGLSRAACAWSALLLAAFYLTGAEWAQVQPDTWMLLPALAALHLRRKRTEALTGAGPGLAPRWAVVEGALWGAACLVKPYAAVPGLLACLASAALARRSGPGWPRRLAPDALGLLAGGLAAGALWQGWLVAHGAWHDYWHNCREFRGDYYAVAPVLSLRPLYVFGKLQPWGLVHLAALPLAAWALLGAVRGRARPGAAGAPALLAALYFGWLIQADFIQMQFDYHMAPTVLLALAVVIAAVGRMARPALPVAALALFGAVAVAMQPACRPARLALWPDCLRRGGTPELRDRLALSPTSPSSADLQRVADYLRGRGVGDRDVLCYDLSTTYLQADLNTRPATRHLYPAVNLFFFTRHRAATLDELKAGPQRFIVTEAAQPENTMGQWPYSEPVVFRAGRYLVHEARRGDASAR